MTTGALSTSQIQGLTTDGTVALTTEQAKILSSAQLGAMLTDNIAEGRFELTEDGHLALGYLMTGQVPQRQGNNNPSPRRPRCFAPATATSP